MCVCFDIAFVCVYYLNRHVPHHRDVHDDVLYWLTDLIHEHVAVPSAYGVAYGMTDYQVI